MRSVSWHETLRAALPETPIRWIVGRPRDDDRRDGLGGRSPGRIGEPTRIVVLSRRLEGPTRRLLPIVAGTVFSQTLINLLALAILRVVTFSSVPLLTRPRRGGALALRGAAGTLRCSCSPARACCAFGRRSRSARVRAPADAVARLLRLARQGLVVFARPRYGVAASTVQLLAWALQWLACYAVMLALGLQPHAASRRPPRSCSRSTSAPILPATPSNVGVFQAACLVVLAAYGVGAGPGARLRHHPAGGRGRHRAGAGRPGAAGGGSHLARHPRRRRRRPSEAEAGLAGERAQGLAQRAASSAAPPSAHSRSGPCSSRSADPCRDRTCSSRSSRSALCRSRCSRRPSGSRGAASRTASSWGSPRRCSRIRPCPRGSRGTAGCGSAATSCAARRRTPR